MRYRILTDPKVVVTKADGVLLVSEIAFGL